MMMLLFVLLKLTDALPFVSTWNTTQANEVLNLPRITTVSNVTINWGDGSPSEVALANTSGLYLNHTYASPGLHNVSMDGRFLWTLGSGRKLVDIVSWGDGFLVNQTINLFQSSALTKLTAPPNTQPVFLPGATLEGMFFRATSFNSPLNWDLVNVTSSMYQMFAYAESLNQPITFRNTQGVTTLGRLFYQANSFNQPFHFDATSVTMTQDMFYNATAFNQVVNLTNTRNLTYMAVMFRSATSFNQPLNFDTASVTSMAGMFTGATSFNQPVNFNVSKVFDMGSMFYRAMAFNQPINFNCPNLTRADYMFAYAQSFNQPVTLNTANLTSMPYMFLNASGFASTLTITSVAKVMNMSSAFLGADKFTQDLSGWAIGNVVGCSSFCAWCGLPKFTQCVPCAPLYTNAQNLSVCTAGTRAPTPVPLASSAPTTSSAPSMPASSSAPSMPGAGPSVSAAVLAAGPSFVSHLLLLLLPFVACGL